MLVQGGTATVMSLSTCAISVIRVVQDVATATGLPHQGVMKGDLLHSEGETFVDQLFVDQHAVTAFLGRLISCLVYRS